jgi:hypothetical protein
MHLEHMQCPQQTTVLIFLLFYPYVVYILNITKSLYMKLTLD